MKSKVELYVLVGLIVVTTLYIALRQDKNINYKLPDMKTFVSGDISSINYSGFELKRSGDDWLLPSGYKIQKSAIDRITKELSDLKLIDMISKSKQYSTYGLDKSKNLTVYNGDKELLNIEIGSTSNSGNYTYVKLPNRDEVYSVRGDLNRELSKSEEQLRNRVILSCDDISTLEITKGDTFITKKSDELEDIAPTLKSLEVKGFDDIKRKNPILTLKVIDTSGSVKTLIIYEKVDNNYPATSSEVNFPFTLPDWVVTKLQAIK